MNRGNGATPPTRTKGCRCYELGDGPYIALGRDYKRRPAAYRCWAPRPIIALISLKSYISKVVSSYPLLRVRHQTWGRYRQYNKLVAYVKFCLMCARLHSHVPFFEIVYIAIEKTWLLGRGKERCPLRVLGTWGRQSQWCNRLPTKVYKGLRVAGFLFGKGKARRRVRR